jgi:hypothetical protein
MHQVLVIAAGIILAAVVLQRWRTLMRIVVVLLLAAGLAIAVVAPIAVGAVAEEGQKKIPTEARGFWT